MALPAGLEAAPPAVAPCWPTAAPAGGSVARCDSVARGGSPEVRAVGSPDVCSCGAEALGAFGSVSDGDTGCSGPCDGSTMPGRGCADCAGCGAAEGGC